MAHSSGKDGTLEQFKPITKLSELAEIQKNKYRNVLLYEIYKQYFKNMKIATDECIFCPDLLYIHILYNI